MFHIGDRVLVGSDDVRSRGEYPGRIVGPGHGAYPWYVRLDDGRGPMLALESELSPWAPETFPDPKSVEDYLAET